MATDKRDDATEATPLIQESPNYGPSSDVNFHSIGKQVSSHGTEYNRYNEYNTIDWLQDLVIESPSRSQPSFQSPRRGIRNNLSKLFDASHGWTAAVAIGIATAVVASFVDIGIESAADLKDGYCTEKLWMSRRACCALDQGGDCKYWRPWSTGFGSSYAVYTGLSLLFGIVAASLTTTTKTNLPSAATSLVPGKTMYMAAGTGIPEIKTILSGFDIPRFFDPSVLGVKGVGSIFAVATGMCLGREGPLVHIAGGIGQLVSAWIPKYANNQRKMREMLSVSCSAGLSVAFGAPIGGVLFSYEQISTYFPRQVLWRACLCSVVAAATLKELNPMGTGRLAMFQTVGSSDYGILHYLGFVLLGLCGGLVGGLFCRSNLKWFKTVQQMAAIQKSPTFEVFIVAMITALLQFPNPLLRETGDKVLQRLLVDCNSAPEDWICQQEARTDGKGTYYAWLILGTFSKLFLTTITFNTKVPSGIIMPAMDSGALFGRLVGQFMPGISPGVLALVGSAAFLAGMSRMTVSLAVTMFELTGDVALIPPFMVTIIIAKRVADYVHADGAYELGRRIQGHPFLDAEDAVAKVKKLREAEGSATVSQVLPDPSTMEDVTLRMGMNHQVATAAARNKLEKLRARGLMDAGLVVVNEQGICHGYIPQATLESALETHSAGLGEGEVDGVSEVSILDNSLFGTLDRTPLTVLADAPLEYAIEIFSKLGVSYLVVVQEETAKVVGVLLKKQLLGFLDD